MVEPVSTAIALKIAAGFAGKMALKAYFLGKMVALKSFLTSYVGASAAGVSASVLAAACAAAFWEMKVKGNSDSDAVTAAMAKGVGGDVAWGIVSWLHSHA